MSETPVAPKTALERLEALEQNVNSLSTELNKVVNFLQRINQGFADNAQVIQRNNEIFGDRLKSTAQLAEFLAETVTATVGVLKDKQLVSDPELVSKVTEIREEKKREVEENLIKAGFVKESEVSTKSSLVVGRSEINGKTVSAREHFDVASMESEVQPKFLGIKVGDVVQFDEGLKIEVLRVLETVSGQEPNDEGDTVNG